MHHAIKPLLTEQASDDFLVADAADRESLALNMLEVAR
jgi:hypothetical protein